MVEWVITQNSYGYSGMGAGMAAVGKSYTIDYASPLRDALMEAESGAGSLTYRHVYELRKLQTVVYRMADGAGSVMQYVMDDETGELELISATPSGNMSTQGIVKLWHHHARLGSVDYMTDNVQGRAVAYATYNDWGMLTSKAVLKCGARELDLVSEYTGHPYDAVLGMYYARARMYDPANSRRFHASDAAKDGSNWYVYCKNNPVTLYDPCGNWAKGDSQFSYEIQLQLLALTIAYERSASEMSRTFISKKAEEVRRNSPKKDSPLPISSELDSYVSTKGILSKSDLAKALGKHRISFTGSVLDFSTYKLHVGLFNENLVEIIDSNGKFLGYGGNQSWLNTAYERYTGCGAISATNIVFYYYTRLKCNSNPSVPVEQDDFLDMFYRHFSGHDSGDNTMIITATGYESVLERIYEDEIGYKPNIAGTSTLTTTASKALGMVISSLMLDNPVALQNWFTPKDSPVTSMHWVTITSADIKPFDFVNSSVGYATWAVVVNSKDGYIWSQAWVNKASIVYIS